MQLCAGIRDRNPFKVSHLSYSKANFIRRRLFKNYASIYPVRLGLCDTLRCSVYNIKVSLSLSLSLFTLTY